MIDLRDWQVEALHEYEQHPTDSYLVVATPGAGKTLFSLAVAGMHLRDNPDHRIIVVAPTSHLKVQWAQSAAWLRLNLEPAWETSRLFDDVQGHAITYSQLGRHADAIAQHADRCFVILDEVHHAGSDMTWGDALHTAFGKAPKRLLISGTPFRSDNNPIPFVTYGDDGVAVADYAYGYGEAIHDHIVRPVHFPRIGGRMEWNDSNGNLVSATFEDPVDTQGANQRLRTALAPDSEWLRTVLAAADERLDGVRDEHDNAGGLVIAMSQTHARQIANVLTELTGERPAIALSDDPQADSTIVNFAASKQKWMVAVRMISEGVDIPRLRVGVYATNVLTEMFFRQAVGRVVRAKGDMDPSWFYIPDDSRLRHYAEQIDAMRLHELTDVQEERRLERAETAARVGSQYQAISAVAGDEELTTHAPRPETVALREMNKQLTEELVALTRKDSRRIIAELNRRSGVRRVANASDEELHRRAEVARSWVDAVSR